MRKGAQVIPANQDVVEDVAQQPHEVGVGRLAQRRQAFKHGGERLECGGRARCPAPRLSGFARAKRPRHDGTPEPGREATRQPDPPVVAARPFPDMNAPKRHRRPLRWGSGCDRSMQHPGHRRMFRQRQAFEITTHSLGNLAEGMGFEPTVEVDPLQQFSKLPPSATRPPLRRERQHGICTYAYTPPPAGAQPSRPRRPKAPAARYFSGTAMPFAVAGRASIASYQRFTFG